MLLSPRGFPSRLAIRPRNLPLSSSRLYRGYDKALSWRSEVEQVTEPAMRVIAEIAFLHLKKTVKGTGRTLRGRSVPLARQEAWALLLIHNMTATIAARAAGQAGIDPRLIPFTAVLALIRGHVTADTCCPHCGKRPASGNDPIALLVNQVLAQPAHRDRPARTSGRTAFQRQHCHIEEVTYTITIAPSNLPKANIRPGS